ncbi:Biotin--[biotin carboxyl-carrier protein] ligase [Lentibacillus sp. JNUCC-1]|uniref:biotin--[acetyl-CoA-carboxylase] ligase n=1 Tax=Lentibacillus sp. JNUCC-1 TaxID=2654513 RepID=UPI0012E83934|nr:biotin--[acetyl-CoA-carboxylase] ligase [Lentibacillus sp. JNUCC-1]MUV39796.1 Biotin--[biotin carboxyl-carrier protein] ligase [Lentibacillus sp. JNUCC-1]
MSSTRQALIRILAGNKQDNTYISGQQLSEKLNISRTAVWKYMNDLKQDGFIINAVPNKGYRIQQFPSRLSANSMQWGLETKWLGQRIVHKNTVPSTQFVAHDLAREGAEHGTVVIANEQTAGRGRLNRKWQSRRDKGIWMSMILRPNMLPHLAPQLTLLTACAVAEAVLIDTHLTPQIKWPNDILFNGRKAVGILTEMQAEQDRIQYVIIGIGVNVNHNTADLAEGLTQHATSLQIESNEPQDIVQLSQQILVQFERLYASYCDKGFSVVKDKWERYAYKMNEPIAIHTHNKTSSAIFRGIAEDGALCIEEKGMPKKIYSAEIVWDDED